MPRYYRRRTTRVVKPKKKWATNMRDLVITTARDTAPSTLKAGFFQLLCANKSEVDEGATIPTPTVIKTGNYKVQCDSRIVTSAAALVNLTMYIVFIPEGVFTPSAAESVNTRYRTDFDNLRDIVLRHPEWILAWRQFGSDQVSDHNNLDRITFSSRLKRNLNSGDQIYAVILAESAEGEGNIIGLSVHGVCQFWTCAN